MAHNVDEKTHSSAQSRKEHFINARKADRYLAAWRLVAPRLLAPPLITRVGSCYCRRPDVGMTLLRTHTWALFVLPVLDTILWR